MTLVPGQSSRVIWGVASATGATIVAALLWGRAAIVGAAVFGAVAIGLQLLAARIVARTGMIAPDQLKGYLVGVALRLSGVAVLGLAVGLDRSAFPPLASAMGYLGTVLPLLYLETRLSR